MNRSHWKLGVAVCTAVLLWAPACSDDGDSDTKESFECGAGTVLEDGECILAEHDCPDDLVASPLGRCEEPGIFCGDGAGYDVEEDACISLADIVCGEDTVQDGGVCRVEDPLYCGAHTLLAGEECVLAESVCGPGAELEAPHCEPDEDAACQGRTEWDVISGSCVDLGIVECGENTVEVDDACLPMSSVADELAADADIDYDDGLPIEAGEDAPFIFTGTLDETLSHSFTFDGSEGQWVEIHLYSRGLPSPGLHLGESIGSWEHRVSAGLSNQPSIRTVMPADDDFELHVSTFLNDDDHPQASGDSSWQYVGTAQLVDTPEAVEWEELDETLTGDFGASTPQLVALDVSEIDDILLTADELGDDAEDPRVELWHATEGHIDRIDMEAGKREELDVSQWSEIELYFYAAELRGPRTEFAVDATPTETLPADGFFEHEFSAHTGEVIFISHRSSSANPVSMSVWRGQEEQYHLDEVLAENQSSYTATTTKHEFFYVPEDGDYLVEFQNTSDEDIEGFISTSTIEEVPTFEVPDEGPVQFEAVVDAEDLDQGDWQFALIETPSAGLFDITISAAAGNPRASVFDTQRNELVDTFGSLGVANMSLEVAEAGAYFVVSRPWSSITLVSDLLFEIEGRAVDTLDPGDVYERAFDVDAFDILAGEVFFGSGESMHAQLVNPEDQVIFEANSTEEPIEIAELIPGPGEFTLHVENTGDEPLLGIDDTLEATTPVEVLNVDDAFSENFTLDALSAGDRVVVVFQSQVDLLIDMTAIFDSDEEAAGRLWDIDESSLVIEVEDEQRVDVETPVTPGIYALELEAITELSSSSHLGLMSSLVHFVEAERTHAPTRQIPAGEEDSSALSVDECNEIVDISLAMDMPSGLATQIYVELAIPGVTDPFILRSGNSGSLTTTYPDETSPVDSFDDLLGESADGVWLMEIENQSCCTDAALASWSVYLTCAQ